MKKDLEKIFRTSSSNNELFDAFQYAINNEIGTHELFKILLANPTLNTDEIKMYTETLANIFKDSASEVYSWTGIILESYANSPPEIEEAISYFLKSWNADKENHEPLINIINMYNFDYDTTYNNLIIEAAKKGAELVKYKSRVYFALAELHEKRGEIELKRKHMLLAEQAAKKENQ